MPVPLPMWPSTFAAPSRPLTLPTAAPRVPRRRWMIVDRNVHREVGENEYLASLASCERVEVASYPGDDAVISFCYRGQS